MIADEWEVQRWSGRTSDFWHTVYRGPDEQAARNEFNHQWTKAKRGGVRLLHGSHVVAEYHRGRIDVHRK